MRVWEWEWEWVLGSDVVQVGTSDGGRGQDTWGASVYALVRQHRKGRHRPGIIAPRPDAALRPLPLNLRPSQFTRTSRM